ncbi:MAG: ABC transporter ATP-binding protein [Desulfobacterales bacterium]|nr:ABC transporter ATP-binding protein [Desulfobacterales bacterium]
MAIMNLSFTVLLGQIKGVIGPNGAGKTTLFNIITGMLPPTAGTVQFKGKAITGEKPNVIAQKGISRTFQTVELFGNMTVLENVMVGRHPHTRMGLLRSGLRLPGVKSEERKIRKAAEEKLNLVGLTYRASDPASSLPLGEQKLLEMARALATDPELILLDEPAAGLNETEILGMAEIIGTIRERGITVLLVEHHMELIMGISDEVVVLNYGKIISEGPPSKIKNDRNVIDAYLGEEIDYA